jgi:hypothetical protein
MTPELLEGDVEESFPPHLLFNLSKECKIVCYNEGSKVIFIVSTEGKNHSHSNAHKKNGGGAIKAVRQRRSNQIG